MNTIAECSFPSNNNLLKPLHSIYVSFPHFELGWILHQNKANPCQIITYVRNIEKTEKKKTKVVLELHSKN